MRTLANRDYLLSYPESLVKIVLEEMQNPVQRQQLTQWNKQWKNTFKDGRVGFRLSEMGRWANETTPLLQNVVSEFAGSRDQGKTWIVHLIAIRKINKGEEILWNYGQQYGTIGKCIACKQHGAAWKEATSNKAFCSHLCQRIFYGMQKEIIF